MKRLQNAYFIIGVLIIAGAFIFAYSELVQKEDYAVRYKIPCDPQKETCFIEICDPEVSTECTGNEEEDTSFYTTMYRDAHNIPKCEEYESEKCIQSLSICLDGEEDCYQETCEQAHAEDDSIECSNPEEYSEEVETGDMLIDEQEN